MVRAGFGALIAVLCILVMILVPDPASGRPSAIISRQKRGSDQRLAELETLLALNKLRGRLVKVPIGFGKVDPEKIGRRRRSNADDRLQKLQHILQVMAVGSKQLSEEEDNILSFPWKDADERREDERDYQLI